MPARTVSSSATARGAPTIPPSSRGIKSRAPASKEVRGKGVQRVASPATSPSSTNESLLSAIKEPSRCTSTSLECLLEQLGTSASLLGLTLSSPSSSKAKPKGKSSTASIRPDKEEHSASQAVGSATNSEQRRIHLAKQVVNAVIASLNDLIASGWKAEGSNEAVVDCTPSRSTSAAGSSRSSSVAAATPRSTTTVSRAKNEAAVKADNVIALFSCSRVAVHYLAEARGRGSLPNSKELELESIMSSMARKMVAMELHSATVAELAWLQGELLSQYSLDKHTESSFGFAIPSSEVSVQVQDLILDVQSLSFNCALCATTPSQAKDLLRTLLQHPQGPLSWQHYIRSTRGQGGSKESADRHAYSIERSMTRYLNKFIKRADWKDHDFAMQCRKVCLDFLLCVSDLDVDAFWDRTARVGSSCFRSKVTSQAAPADERSSAFRSIDDMFRDTVRRAEQVGSKERPLMEGKGFTGFCEVWIQLARRAGEAQAIDHVARLLGRQGSEGVQDAQSLLRSAEQVDGLVAQACARLSHSVLALDEALAGKVSEDSKERDIKAAEMEVESSVQLTALAGDESLQKLFRVLDQLRRRSLRLLEDKGCNVSPLLLAICTHYQRYLERDGKGRVEKDEAILEDYIYILRSLASSTFALSDWTTHECAANYLGRCDSILGSKEAKMAGVSERERCEKMRLLSSSWYYIGGQLYNDKKPHLATRFLKAACESAQQSLQWYESVRECEAGVADKELKRPEGIAKKWEHLAVSYRYASQPRLSYEAYLSGLTSMSQAEWEKVASLASKGGISEIFEEVGGSDKVVCDVAGMAKAAFEVASFELLLYERGEEEDFAARLLKAGVCWSGVGALLEHCLLSLDNTMHREEGPSAATALLASLLRLYLPHQSPLRRARVLIRKMELAVMQPQLFPEEGQVKALVEEAELLLGQRDLSDDADLARFVPQYKAMLQLLLLFSSTTSPLGDIVQIAAEASDRLRKTLDPSPSKLPVRPASGPKRMLQTTSTPRQAKPTPALPVTPPKGRRTRSTATLDVGRKEDQSTSLFDNGLRLCSLIELVFEMMSSSGHAAASLELLTVAKRLAMGMEEGEGLDFHLRFSAALVGQYVLLGNMAKAGRLVDQTTRAVEEKGVTRDGTVRWLLASAAYHCHVGGKEKSKEVYEAAMEIAAKIELPGRVSSLQSVVNRSLVCERQALCNEALSRIQMASGDMVGSLKSAIASVRSAIKAGGLLSRLTASAEAKGGSEGKTPFIADDQECPQTVKVKPAPRLSSWSAAILHWRLIRLILTAHRRLCHIYRLRGSARDAEAFATEAVDFTSALSIPLTLASALIERASIRIQMNVCEKGIADLAQAMQSMGQDSDGRWMGVVEMHMAKGQQEAKAASWQSALHHYNEGGRILASLAKQFDLIDASACPPKSKRAVGEPSHGFVLPELRSRLLQRQGWVLHLIGKMEESREALEQAALLLPTGPGKEENAIWQGRMAVLQSSRALKADQVMGMLPDSAICLPMATDTGKSGGSSRRRATPIKSAISHLSLAQTLLERVVKGRERGCLDSINLREAYVDLAISHTISSALGESSTSTVNEVVAMLDQSGSLTLQREMLDAVDAKVQPIKKTAESGEESSEEESKSLLSSQQYWSRVRRRHADPCHTLADSKLPPNWTVVSITLHRERNCLLVTRRGGGAQTFPLVFSLPIDRQSRREGEEEGEMGVEAVLKELRSIVEESNVATHSAQHLQGLDARKQWWSLRRALDERMKVLLSAVEANWLGAFKAVLLPRPSASDQDFATLRSTFDAILQRALFSASSSGKRSATAGLDSAVFECLSALSLTEPSDEELEDLVHFVMDVYQFQGMPVGVDEVDLDLCVTELRGALDSFRTKQHESEPDDDRHLFLLLDKDTCAIPWESMPLLRKQAVCRIPSMAFLQDRLELCKDQGQFGRFTIASERAKGWYLLNPSQDLARTQERFLPWLQSKQNSRWTGISNRAPVLEEMSEALEQSDIVLYFGHGGGEQYLRPSRLRGLKRCAVTMLWGCSSGVMRDLGDFDRSGTPSNYLMAGCPSLLANLWDATDKELDGVSESVLCKMGLKAASGEGDMDMGQVKGNLSIAQAVAQSRDACKLPYLTGAATVVYGIPVYYQ